MLEIFKEGFKNLINNLKNKNIKPELANLFTLSRLLAPFILIPLIMFNKNILFVIMIIIFSITDAMDGYFARKYNSISLFGKYLDAFVDKIYAGSFLFPIVLFPWIDNKLIVFCWLIITFEIIISILNIYSFSNKLNPHSTYLGKIKTFILFLTISFIYLNKFIYLKSIYLICSLIITLLFQLITIFSYLNQIKNTELKVNSVS